MQVLASSLWHWDSVKLKKGLVIKLIAPWRIVTVATVGSIGLVDGWVFRLGGQEYTTFQYALDEVVLLNRQLL